MVDPFNPSPSRHTTSRLPLGLAAAALLASTALFAQTKEVTFAYQDMLVPLRTIIESGELEKALTDTAAFLKEQGRVQEVKPNYGAFVSTAYVQKALAK